MRAVTLLLDKLASVIAEGQAAFKASGRAPENLGKPSPLVFQALADEVGIDLDRVLMVGDDAEFDASGAVGLGMGGILVRTGKYRHGDEEAVRPRPTAVLDSIAAIPEWLGMD